MAQTKTTRKRKASPDLTESDIDDVPTKRKVTARKSVGGPVGRRLPAASSAGPSARRTSGAQPGWGGGGRGGGGKCDAYVMEYGR